MENPKVKFFIFSNSSPRASKLFRTCFLVILSHSWHFPSQVKTRPKCQLHCFWKSRLKLVLIVLKCLVRTRQWRLFLLKSYSCYAGMPGAHQAFQKGRFTLRLAFSRPKCQLHCRYPSHVRLYVLAPQLSGLSGLESGLSRLEWVWTTSCYLPVTGLSWSILHYPGLSSSILIWGQNHLPDISAGFFQLRK